MMIYLERIYDPPHHAGYRVLADRLWPRGLSKEKAALDEWCKALSPSAELRTWFAHDPAKWKEFSQRYRDELRDGREEAGALLERADGKSLILLSAAKDTEHTHTIVLKRYLSGLLS